MKSEQAPLISIVMPCYNGAAYVREAVESVFAQTYPNTELIVVDDGSTDDSLAIVERYGERLTLLRQQNAGPYPARNLGVAHSRGEFVAFLDADDYWAPDCLQQLAKALLEQPSSALAYCGWQNVGREDRSGAPYVPADFDGPGKAEAMLEAASRWPIHAALVRRSVFDEVGGFQTYLRTCMDYDFWLRTAVNRPIVRVNAALAFYRFHDAGQITSKQGQQAINVWEVKRRFLREFPELVQHIPPERLRDLVDTSLLKRGYDNYWKRDLGSAQIIFRRVLTIGGWRARDLRYLLPALLPSRLYTRLVRLAEK